MPNSVPDATKRLTEAARRQMERWLLSSGLREHMQVGGEVTGRPLRTGPYVAISREAGAGGTRIARLVGQALDWDVLGRELLDFITQRYSVPREMLELVDETRANWVRDVLVTRFESRLVKQDDYATLLERVILLAAIHGSVVFVGRGAHLILPRDQGLAVRVVAPRENRIRREMDRRGIDAKEAEKTIDATEAGRRDFSRRYFGADIEDPHCFDLVINTERVSEETAARQIVILFQQLFPDVASKEA